MGTREQINAINLQKLVDIMWIWIANELAKFHAKRLNQSKNIPNSFRGATFFETPCKFVIKR